MRSALTAFCLLLLAANASAAKIYRWTDSEGRSHFGNQPAPGARNVQAFDQRQGTVLEGGPYATETEEQRTSRLAACADKRKQLSIYQGAAEVIEKDALGRERKYSAEEKKLLITRTEADIEQICGEPRPASEDEPGTAGEAVTEDNGPEPTDTSGAEELAESPDSE